MAKRYATHVTQPDGKKIYLSAKTKEELKHKVAKARLDIGAGIDLSDDTKFEEFARLWLDAYKKGKVRESSYSIYKVNLEAHLVRFFCGMRLRDIKPLHVQQFLASVSHLSRSVQSKCIAMLRNIMAKAVDNGLIAKSPVASDDRPSGEATPEIEPLENEQAKRLLAAVDDTRAYLFCLIALSTGMRREEIIGLMWDDIDFKSRILHVTHSKAFLPSSNDAPVTEALKTAAARRDLPIPNMLYYALLSERLRSTSPFVIHREDGSSLTKASFRALWKIVTVRIATEDKPLGTPIQGRHGGSPVVCLDFQVRPHMLRHTYITQLFEQIDNEHRGLDLKQVQYLAGHSTPEMTLRCYAHYRRRSRNMETSSQVSAAVSAMLA